MEINVIKIKQCIIINTSVVFSHVPYRDIISVKSAAKTTSCVSRFDNSVKANISPSAYLYVFLTMFGYS